MWHDRRKSCFWVDIASGILYEYNWETKIVEKRNFDRPISLVMESNGDSLILAVKGGIVKLDLNTGNLTWLTDLDKHIETNRCNDGGCDVNGRLWVGTMDIDCKEKAGSLYCLDNDLTVKKMIDNLTIPNGLVWSLDNERMYFIDTPSQSVVSYLFKKSNGNIYYEKKIIRVPSEMGMPDGMTIDSEGMLWIALYNGGCITRWNPADGQLLELVKLPALHVTSCAFVGENLDSLLVTSAREDMSSAQLEEYPESGNVFLVSGLPVGGLKKNFPELSN